MIMEWKMLPGPLLNPKLAEKTEMQICIPVLVVIQNERWMITCLLFKE